MKTEFCEPCEWAGTETPAEHFVGWDHMPLCDMHFELDKVGRLGNWVQDNVDFSAEGEAIDAPQESKTVFCGEVKMKAPEGVLLNMGLPEDMHNDKIDSLLFGEPKRTAEDVLRKLEDDAWYYLKGAGSGSTHCLHITVYLIATLNEYGVDVSNLEFSLENLRKNG